MEIIKYPLLYYQLTEQAVLGILVGTSLQIIETDLRKVKSTLLDYMQKQYKKTDDYPWFDIDEPKLKMVEISLRPTYNSKSGSFPTRSMIRVPMPVVYGEVETDYYEAYLPLLEGSFYYYDQRQFRPLVENFAVNELNGKTPDDIYRLMTYKEPKMDTITLRVNDNRKSNWQGVSFKREFPTLQKLAEKLPLQKSQQRRINAGPQTAWELEDKVQLLTEKIRQQRANVLLVGGHGTGKSAVLQQAVRKISQQKGNEDTKQTFWRILPQRITSSSKYLGEWQQTVEEMVMELQSCNGVLWVIDVMQLLRTGGRGPEDSVAAFLLSFIQAGKVQLVGEITPEALDSMRRFLPGFAESFQIIQLEELPEQKIHTLLEKYAEYSLQKHKIDISNKALQVGYRLLKRYYPYERFPGKAIKFFGQCVNIALQKKKTTIDKTLVIKQFQQRTGLPELFLRDELLLDQIKLRSFFEQKIIGQSNAIDRLIGTVKIYKAGLNNPHKPITTLLFAGPTGVGKTASAQALSNYFFGQGTERSPLIRIDMSEYQFPGQLSKFIGAGKRPGKVVQNIRQRPFSVLLLDEVEKAHPSIFDALLTVFDEGIMVDAYGRKTDFRNTIIIMTSNLGASSHKSIGFAEKEDAEAKYLAAIGRFFRPEFVNRIDGIVFFNSLNAKDIAKITSKELAGLNKLEGFTKRGLKLTFSDELKAHLARIGFDEKYGARPLQRAVQQQVIQPLANWLLKQPKLKNKTLHIDWKKDELEVIL